MKIKLGEESEGGLSLLCLQMASKNFLRNRIPDSWGEINPQDQIEFLKTHVLPDMIAYQVDELFSLIKVQGDELFKEMSRFIESLDIIVEAEALSPEDLDPDITSNTIEVEIYDNGEDEGAIGDGLLETAQVHTKLKIFCK